jgi:7,8-dihydropterin-6-yl-methyl-4-(beta-D-ribofuranosyl)aminobenzene 5'-phosphate synthase
MNKFKYMKHTLSAGFLIIISIILWAFEGPKPERKNQISNDLIFTILYDNYLFNNNLESDWGFSCLIEGLGKTILFDTGTKGSVLMSNMKKLGKDPADVDIVFLSHIHQDHTGGIKDFLDSNNNVKVFMPVSFPEGFKKMIKANGTEIVEISGPQEITEGVKTTGEMGTEIIEQSMVIKTEKGSVVITGCAHPGILDIIKKSGEISGNDILLVFGGFHLLDTNNKGLTEVVEEFKKMKVEYAGPTHCSGDKTIEIFKEKYGNKFIGLGVGRVLKMSELQ